MHTVSDCCSENDDFISQAVLLYKWTSADSISILNHVGATLVMFLISLQSELKLQHYLTSLF